MKTIILDVACMTLKSETHRYLKEKLGFPEYYGGNLDALYDCLTEMAPTEIVFVNTDQASEYFEKVHRVFEDAAKYSEALVVSDSHD